MTSGRSKEAGRVADARTAQRPAPRPTQRQKIEELLSDGQTVRRRDLLAAGFSDAVVQDLISKGVLVALQPMSSFDRRFGYRLASAEIVEPSKEALAAAAMSIGAERGLICLWSALRIHDLTDVPVGQEPDCIALKPGVNPNPRSDLEIRIIRWTDVKRFDLGVETLTIARGISMPITSAARTVLDLYAPIRLREDLRINSQVRSEALGKLVARDPAAPNEIMTLASQMGPTWETSIRDAVEAAVVASNWHGSRPGL